jgi:hypothetical protein
MAAMRLAFDFIVAADSEVAMRHTYQKNGETAEASERIGPF